MTVKTLNLSVAALALAATPVLAGTMSKTDETSQADTAYIESAEQVANDTQDSMGTVLDSVENAETMVPNVDGADIAADRMEMADAALTVDDLVGTNVLSANNETVGEIDYVIRDGDDYAAIVGLGGFLGLGEYTVEVPMSEFVRTEDEELRLVTWTEEELEALPEFDESEVNELPGDYKIDTSI